MLEETAQRMRPLGLTLRAEEAAVEKLAKECYDPTNGARPLRRALRQKVADVAAEGILSGRFQKGDTILFTVHKMDLVLEKDLG